MHVTLFLRIEALLNRCSLYNRNQPVRFEHIPAEMSESLRVTFFYYYYNNKESVQNKQRCWTVCFDRSASAEQLHESLLLLLLLTFHPLISLITVAMAAKRSEKANNIGCYYRKPNFRGTTTKRKHSSNHSESRHTAPTLERNTKGTNYSEHLGF